MFNTSKDINQRIDAYLNARRIQLKHELGSGKDGSVLSTNVGTAIKAFYHAETFAPRERDCYLRLGGVEAVLGHRVPQLLDADDDCLVIEMTIVKRPFLLDFASAYLDVPPDFSPEVVEEWERAKQEEFGEHWGQVVVLLDVLREQYGIYLLDVHPGNIAFEEEATE